MKTLINILIGILTIGFIPVQSAAQLSDKLYQVTPDGKFQFIYWQFANAPKGTIHPVTPRTFYLETRRQGLISKDLSFTDFLSLASGQLQPIIESSQAGIITAINNAAIHTDGGQGAIISSREALVQQLNNESDTSVEFPWLIKGVSHPAYADGTPDINAPDATINSQPAIQASREIPWIVRVMLMPETVFDYGVYENQNWQANNSGKERKKEEKFFVIDPSTNQLFQDITRDSNNVDEANEQADKRMRLWMLLNDLMAYQNDEIQRKYGRVFPAIEGKLYGTTDAELDEILTALLGMKDDFLAGSKPEVNKIFNELEALAFGK